MQTKNSSQRFPPKKLLPKNFSQKNPPKKFLPKNFSQKNFLPKKSSQNNLTTNFQKIHKTFPKDPKKIPSKNLKKFQTSS
jgi:hypothetical protein